MFKQRLEQYCAQREEKISGVIKYIPFPLEAVSRYVPGIMRSTYYCITSFTNVGKTPLAKYLFVITPFLYYKQTKRFNLKIMYFCLEETREQFIDGLICAMLYDKYNIRLDYTQLNSYDNPIDSSILQKIATFEDTFSELESILSIVPNVTTTDDIMNYIRNYADSAGSYYNIHERVTRFEPHTHYVPADKDEFVIIVTDHVNILTPRTNETLAATMDRHSTNHMLHECVKMYGYSVCDVHQQAAEGESAEYNKFNKNECSLSTLGDNKKVGRNYQVVLGLDMPQRYGISNHGGYNLDNFPNKAVNYRSLRVLKNRYGVSMVRKGLWFNPHSITFTELPTGAQIKYEDYA